MAGLADKLSAGVMVGAVIKSDQTEAKEAVDPVIFLTQYANYADVFDKFCINILSEYTQQNLMIKTKDNKILFFDPTYDHSRLKLEV